MRLGLFSVLLHDYAYIFVFHSLIVAVAALSTLCLRLQCSRPVLYLFFSAFVLQSILAKNIWFLFCFYAAIIVEDFNFIALTCDQPTMPGICVFVCAMMIDTCEMMCSDRGAAQIPQWQKGHSLWSNRWSSYVRRFIRSAFVWMLLL